jgi:hypothetical protein
MFDYSTYLLEIDRMTTQIHDDICHRRFGQAQLHSMELLISARHLQLWLRHKQEAEMERSNGSSN